MTTPPPVYPLPFLESAAPPTPIYPFQLIQEYLRSLLKNSTPLSHYIITDLFFQNSPSTSTSGFGDARDRTPSQTFELYP